MSELEFDMFVLRTELESCLVMNFWPIFLSVDILENDIGLCVYQVTLCSSRFAGMPVNDRISEVFRAIKDDKIDLKGHSIVVEAFDSKEFADIIDQSFI